MRGVCYMSLLEREYMKETFEEKKLQQNKFSQKQKRKDELWKLYGKKHKTIFDKIRIKKLEKMNLSDS